MPTREELIAVLASHRGTLDEIPRPDNELVRILREQWQDVPLRRAAWEARMSIGPRLAPGLRRLARDGQPPGLPAVAVELAERTEAPFARLQAALDADRCRRFGIPSDQLRPWHHDDPFAREVSAAPDLWLDRFFVQADLEGIAVKTLAAHGHDVGPLIGQADLYERPGKLQQPALIDGRLFACLRPDQRWMRRLLALCARAVGDPALGCRLARLPDDADWLVGTAGAHPDRVAEIAHALPARRRERLLVRVRFASMLGRFEQRLYEQPDSDLNGCWRELRLRYQRLADPPGRDAPDWAAVPELLLEPGWAGRLLEQEVEASRQEGRDLLEELTR